MDNIIRQFTLLRYIRDCNRQGKYPQWKDIKRKIDAHLGDEERYNNQMFLRDREKLNVEWKCYIDFRKEGRDGYYYHEKEGSAVIDDLLTSYLLLSARNKDGLLPEYVIAETRTHTGTEYLAQCMDAIEEHCELHITYYDYRDDTEKTFAIQPYKLKHKDYKWYVLAVDTHAPEVPFKAFALERIRSMKEGKAFRPNTKIDFYSQYRDAFGMFTDVEAEKVVLQFDRRDGNYLKAQPIHPSQKVIAETETHITLELYIRPTLDFVMELMKRSWSLSILEPASLRETFVNYWQEAIKRNSAI